TPPAVRSHRITDAQVNVADYRAIGRGLIGLGRSGCCEQDMEIKRQRLHDDFVSLPLPDIRRAISVNFDAVSFRIGQVDGFADQMVGCTLNSDFSLNGALRPAGKIGTFREQEGGVKEARLAWIVR